jgi:hypothetical protein
MLPDLEHVIQHATRAHKEGFIIEALQVLHGLIELLLRELIMSNRAVDEAHENFDLAYDTMFEIPSNIAIKVLFIQKVVTKSERDELVRFNSLRNGIMHKIFTDETVVPNESQYQAALDLGIRVAELLTNKVHKGS